MILHAILSCDEQANQTNASFSLVEEVGFSYVETYLSARRPSFHAFREGDGL